MAGSNPAGPGAGLSDIEREGYEKQIFDLRNLLEVSKSLNSTLDYNILIDSILLTVMGQMKVLKAGLYARKGLDAPVFSLHRNYKGFEIRHDIDYSIPEDHAAIKLFQRHYGCYSLSDIKFRLGDLSGLEGLVSLDPSLIIPLKAKGVINGIIVLADRIDDEPYDVFEREQAIDIAAFAAIAINNAFLFEMTTTDMMTRLKMKHYFYTVLLEKMERAALAEKPLSVMMIDIDHFKIFNDTHGHLLGDQVLKHVARIVQQSVRNQDLAARYGGEEFCVLLHESDRFRARAIAERLRQTVATSPIEHEGKSLAVTVSIGVAQYDPSRDLSGKSLIDRADRGLYVSKHGGRNRVSIAD